MEKKTQANLPISQNPSVAPFHQQNEGQVP